LLTSLLVDIFEDAQNYITLQHNTLGEWLHDTLCKIFAASGGSCSREIGPLEAHQGFIPMEVHWPEGQLTMMERLEQFDNLLYLSAPDGVAHENEVDNSKFARLSAYSASKGNMNVGDLETKLDAVEAKVNALSNDVQTKVNALSNDVHTKVDAVKTQVNAVEAKVDSLIELNKQLINLLDQKHKE
jgi:outer membrane murein-binding lipoprotein Lpp